MSELGHGIAHVFGLLIALVGFAAFLTWIERRLLGFFQDRYGPTGSARSASSGGRRHDQDPVQGGLDPAFRGPRVFVLAPAIIMVTLLIAFAVIPIAPGIGVVSLNIGLLFFLAMTSLAVYSTVLGGWASNNKYSLMGGVRAAAQMLSYEVFMGLSLVGVVMLAGSFTSAPSSRRSVGCGTASRRSSVCSSSRTPALPRPTAAVRFARGGGRTDCRLPHGVPG